LESGAGCCRFTAPLRSRRGFLERLHSGDAVIGAVRDAWERPVRAVLRSLRIPDRRFDHALFLQNLLFDPREVLDLTGQGLAMEAALAELIAVYHSALRGWAET
jgi:hypothetical protein